MLPFATFPARWYYLIQHMYFTLVCSGCMINGNGSNGEELEPASK